MLFDDKDYLKLEGKDIQGLANFKNQFKQTGIEGRMIPPEVTWSNAVWKYADSLFPNHVVYDEDIKEREQYLLDQTETFKAMLDDVSIREQDILNFLRNQRAYHLILGLFQFFEFGHHDRYLFREFKIGTSFQADYLLIGRGSGGTEFVWVELESHVNNITIKSGDFGTTIRKGLQQTNDWEKFINGNFSAVRAELQKHKSPEVNWEDEYINYDPHKMHYVVVAGRRPDFNERTYEMRRQSKMTNRLVLHYDNLVDKSEWLVKLRKW